MYMRVIGQQNMVDNKVLGILYGLTTLLFMITPSSVKKKKKC